MITWNLMLQDTSISKSFTSSVITLLKLSKASLQSFPSMVQKQDNKGSILRLSRPCLILNGPLSHESSCLWARWMQETCSNLWHEQKQIDWFFQYFHQWIPQPLNQKNHHILNKPPLSFAETPFQLSLFEWIC